MDKFEKLRPLGILEKHSTCRHNLGFYFSVAVTATYTLPESFTLPVKDYIYRACETLIGQHPILSAIPFDESTKDPYWVRLPEIDLDGLVSFQERSQSCPEGAEKDTELDDLLNIQHSTGFLRGSPVWRLCVLTDPSNSHRFTAAFVSHHAISDGTSAKAFHRTFLQALHTTPSHPKTNHIIPSPSTPLLPTMESLHPLPVSFSYLASEIIKAKIWTPSHPPSLWTGPKVTSPSPTKIRHLIISPSSANTLKLLSRKHSSTITATLQTILARSIFPQLPPQYTSLNCSGAISTRRFLDNSIITNDSIGSWVTVYEQPYTRNTLNLEKKDPKTPFPWQTATNSRSTITNKLAENLKNSPVTMLKYVKDFHTELCLSKVGKERGASYEVTNVGVFDPLPPPPSSSGGGEDRPKIGRMVFSQSASVIGCAIEVSVIMGGDGCLVLVFAWQEGAVEDGLVGKIMDGVEREVRELDEADC